MVPPSSGGGFLGTFFLAAVAFPNSCVNSGTERGPASSRQVISQYTLEPDENRFRSMI
jgi:hypothetical protein